MRVGQIITFKLPSSQKKIAGKILEVREKNLLVQTKDSKKVIPKSLLNKKITKEEFEKARLELQKILKKKSTKSSIEKTLKVISVLNPLKVYSWKTFVTTKLPSNGHPAFFILIVEPQTAL